MGRSSKLLSILTLGCTCACLLSTCVPVNAAKQNETAQSNSQDMQGIVAGVKWIVKTDVGSYDAMTTVNKNNIGDTLNIGDYYDNLPKGFKFVNEDGTLTERPQDKLYTITKPKGKDDYIVNGVIKRIYSVKPDKTIKRSLTIKYHDTNEPSKQFDSQIVEGTQGETVPVKFKLPPGYGFSSAPINSSLYYAFPASHYTFATQNPDINVAISKIPNEKNSNATITVHYIDYQTKKDLHKDEVLHVKAGEHVVVPFTYPPMDFECTNMQLNWKYDKDLKMYLGDANKILNYADASKNLKALKDNNTTFGYVNPKKGNTDIYAWIYPNGKPVKQTTDTNTQPVKDIVPDNPVNNNAIKSSATQVTNTANKNHHVYDNSNLQNKKMPKKHIKANKGSVSSNKANKNNSPASSVANSMPNNKKKSTISKHAAPQKQTVKSKRKGILPQTGEQRSIFAIISGFIALISGLVIVRKRKEDN